MIFKKISSQLESKAFDLSLGYYILKSFIFWTAINLDNHVGLQGLTSYNNSKRLESAEIFIFFSL